MSTSRTKLRLSRRHFLQGATGLTAAVVAAPVFYVKNGWAAGKQIQMGIWGGAQGEFIKKKVLPGFENDFDCKVLAEEGSTLGQISKMRATKSNPSYSVMFVDDLAIPICKAEGLIAPLPKDKMPNLANLYPRFLQGDGYGTALGISSGGMFYNTSITPPASFAELWDPKWKQRIKLCSAKNTPSMFFLIAAASVVTGKPFGEAQYEIEKAWDKIAEIKPNIQNLYDSGIQAVNEVAQGQADVGGIEYSKYVYPYTVKGVPIDLAFMKEGTFAGINSQVLVKDGPNMDLGAAFMDRMLDPKVQKPLAEFALIAPPVAGIDLSKDTLKYVAYPETKMNELGLFSPDWAFINKNRSVWTEKMNQIFAV